MDAEQLEQTYRQEATRLRAAIARRLGDVGLAEEVVQDAFVEAIEHWSRDGTPANPGGWLMTTAWRKAVDSQRRAAAGREKLALLAVTQELTAPPASEPGADDDLLSLVFACCHPSLPADSQVALTLRTVCGLTTGEIGAAFLVSEQAMGQRLSRAKRSLREAGVAVSLPEPDELRERLSAVLAVVYLVFNEGYLASAGRTPARRDLASRAVALARMLQRLMPREAEVLGLVALLLLHESRAAARFDGWGRLIRLEEQDRRLWDAGLAAEATALLDGALALRQPGPYQVQAAVAALHAAAPTYAQTDWQQIRLLYGRLQVMTPSPVVTLNRAVATRFAVGPGAALAEVEPLAPALSDYRLFHAVRAELLTALGRVHEARAANERALALAENPAERELLTRRLAGTGPASAHGRPGWSP